MSEYNPKDVTVPPATAVAEPAPAPAVVADSHFTICVADKDGKEIPPNAMGFVGVCLSYAIRTHSFSLQDLTRSDSDYLAPEIRLLLAGAIATLLALFCIVGLGDVELGSIKLSDIAVNPMLAFVIGAVLGIGEKKLTGTIEKRTGVVLGSLDK